MKHKVSKDVLKKYNAYVSSDTTFASYARLLQSLWREEKGFPKGIYTTNKNTPIELGNLIKPRDVEFKYANFLTETIGSLVENEINGHPEKVIQKPRIWNNLLSSQPLAFNLFGELKLEQSYLVATKVFQRIFPNEITQITRIEFEYSPGRRNPNFTNDRSAFDVYLEYTSCDGRNGFLGIEIKYAENIQDKPAEYRDEYKRIATEMDIFKEEAIETLKTTNIQQIWRDHLLAGSLLKTKEMSQTGKFIFLYPEENIQCCNAIEKYQKTLTTTDQEKTFFFPITLEYFVGHLKDVTQDRWIRDFESRYLDFEKIDRLLASS